ncbi:type I-E CRISPR-associated protein Cas7/Cse4/CasC [Nonomuraea cavernae]|uniref:Type I-E CRISPR-associated protein Cas7/Cse4/CasC n=1 Tax=Nonomuraea cavernae TaxID=2045107 RepID=A0A918DS64_9ACTN|nr:type I-E CRISPR-associated protein Cas7/Cse4/CasC [Nonomuraea cavernae]MCA2190623.1 type I-E CRISPR-associated protein Cas7/Cse4/CasC [Nonomuraea cavernae]GGO81326.1 type I-E CRISPR-associated protein Cas7/Cse4/CasC [Nonomuraea cavernae]
MTTPRFIDIHLLQTLPYSNINRDDLGSPKNVVYGGVSRTRVSSQSWKRAVRLAVEQALGDPAARTRRIPEQVAQRLAGRGWPSEVATAAGQQVVLSAGKGLKVESDGVTSVLLYLPTSALDELADLAAEHREQIQEQAGKKKPTPVLPTERIAELLSRRNGVINLFGRMLAELPSAEVDGSVQVAHAFTTHGTSTEVDFFTAVDDLNPNEMRGSGHMNSAEFSSGVFYRYASLDVTGLLENLDDHSTAAELTSAFLTAFISALPTGKQNSTAANTIPDLAYIAVRSDRPVSLAPAFETPIKLTDEGGYAARSRDALASYAQRLHTLWGQEGVLRHAHATIDAKELSGLGDKDASYASLIQHAVATAYPSGSGA